MAADANQDYACVLQGSGTDVIIRCACRPGRSSTCIAGIHGDCLRVDLAAPPEQGKANDALLDLVALVLKVPRRNCALTTGAAARRKSVRVAGLSASGAAALLKAASHSKT